MIRAVSFCCTSLYRRARNRKAMRNIPRCRVEIIVGYFREQSERAPLRHGLHRATSPIGEAINFSCQAPLKGSCRRSRLKGVQTVGASASQRSPPETRTTNGKANHISYADNIKNKKRLHKETAFVCLYCSLPLLPPGAAPKP